MASLRYDRMETSEYSVRQKIIEAYGDWFDSLERDGIDGQTTYGSLITFMFQPIGGSFDTKCGVMFDEVERVYRTLLPHVCRYPSSAYGSSIRPLVVCVPDYPIYKNSTKQPLTDVIPNDGLHLHSYWVMKTDTRLRVPLVTHFNRESQYYKQYVRSDRPLRRIDVRTVTNNPEFVADYAMKALKRRVPDLDKILILPS